MKKPGNKYYIKVQRTADKKALQNLVSKVLIIACHLWQWFQIGNPTHSS